jgi:hypothetical protein
VHFAHEYKFWSKLMLSNYDNKNEINYSESEILCKKVQFYWNLNKLEDAHATHQEENGQDLLFDKHIEKES